MNLDYTKTKARGNVLAGCLIALGVALVLAIIATIFVATSWRGWVSDGIRQGITAALEEAPVSEAERLEIVAHIDTLMTRFDQKEIGFSELGRVVEELAESPLTMAAMMMNRISARVVKLTGKGRRPLSRSEESVTGLGFGFFNRE